MRRPTFVTHQGKRILVIDGKDLLEGELLRLWEEAEVATQAAAPGSMRVLLNLMTLVSHAAAGDLRRRMLAHGDKVLATAIVGTSFWKVIVAGVRSAGRENVEFFPDQAAALDWLVRQ